MVLDYLTKPLQGGSFKAHRYSIMGLIEDADLRYELEDKYARSNSYDSFGCILFYIQRNSVRLRIQECVGNLKESQLRMGGL